MDKDFLKKIQYRIINGESIKNKNIHSYFASICLKGTNIPFCGGSYIGKNIIVTAAHCVENQLKPEETIVQFKKNNINHKGISYKVKNINSPKI